MELTDKRYLQVFERVGKNDTQNVFTPPRLIRRMFSEIDFTSNGKVLVWYNVEILVYLVKEIGLSPKNIYIYTNTEDKLILKKQGYNVVYHESLDFDKITSEFKKMKFDVIVGNPPYHLIDGGGNGSSAVSIYDKFTYKSLELCDKVLLITPSRWFKGGKGLSGFRSHMLSRSDIKLIVHYQNEKEWFDVDLPGGVSYFYIDKKYSGVTKFINHETQSEFNIKLNTRDILISDTVSNGIIDKVLIKGLDNFGDLVLSQNPFGIRAKFSQWGDQGVDCYTKDGVKLVNIQDVNDKFNVMDKYKVITSIADGAAYKAKRYTSRCQVIPPNTVNTETYLICYTSNNENECNNVEKYLMTKFSRFMLSLRMAAQTKSKDKFKWVPVMDFSQSWNDEELYSYFDLTQEEISFIENNVS